MFIKSSDFPVEWMHHAKGDDQSEGAIFTAFDALLDRAKPFVIIGSKRAEDAQREKDSPAERKRLMLWIKQNKKRLRTLVRGMVQIEPSATKRMALKGFMVMAEKIWGYPMLLAASKEEALPVASRLLAEQSVAP